MTEISQKTMGKYCKAYPIARFREFPGWKENSENVRKEVKSENGKEVEVDRVLTDEDHLYLQENYVVTDGIFKDENVIFDDVSEEWTKFCKEVLEFEVPEYEPIAVQEAEQGDGHNSEKSSVDG